ncbi:hypothetical protein PG994_001914 [Apiospora phragmitis]|uniref:Uncharacterized protein n=1 Tax=Apiospora phragmitis TaxID=2905665 RepID=A0ABR1WUW4_9PEZI
MAQIGPGRPVTLLKRHGPVRRRRWRRPDDWLPGLPPWLGNQWRAAIEDALAGDRRQHQEKIAAIVAEIAGHKKAQEEWARGLADNKESNDRLAQENPALRNENDMARHEAGAAQLLVNQRENEVRAANNLVSQRGEESRVLREENERHPRPHCVHSPPRQLGLLRLYLALEINRLGPLSAADVKAILLLLKNARERASSNAQGFGSATQKSKMMITLDMILNLRKKANNLNRVDHIVTLKPKTLSRP